MIKKKNIGKNIMDNKIVKREELENISDKLVDYGKSFQNNGQQLIVAGLERFTNNEQSRMIGKIEELLKHIRQLRAQREKTDSEIILFESRLKQVYDGEITIDAAGTMHWKDGFYI